MGRQKERRSGVDRRQADFVSSSGIERRKRAEARKPEIAEVALSEDEWKRLFGSHRVTIPSRVSIVLAHDNK